MTTKTRKATNYIAVHCSATPEDMDIGVEDIDRWHKERGWIGCGYHFVIRRDGTVEDGRPLNAIGAHVRGFNQNSVGVCLVGTEEFSDEQTDALRELLTDLTFQFPSATVQGHRDFPHVKKSCPGFDVKRWWKSHDLLKRLEAKHL